MKIEPNRRTFQERYDAGEPQIVTCRMVADLETPVSAYLKLAHQKTTGFLLESVEGGAVRGRYSIIGMAPDLVFRIAKNQAMINRRYEVDRQAFEPLDMAPLEALRHVLAQNRMTFPQDAPPMACGLFGFLGYDMIRAFEVLGPANPQALDVPDTLLIRPRVIAVFDAVRDVIILSAPVYPRSEISSGSAYTRACEAIISAVEALEAPLNLTATDGITDAVTSRGIVTADAVSNTSVEQYSQMVARAKDYIAAGDIFQVVLSQRFEAPFTLEPFALYRALRRINPAPFLYFLDFEDFAIAGSSPEILVRVLDGEVTIRPIAGTRPRGKTPSEDAANAASLLADPKELAEHLMLLDLGRNDVGRVCKPGTVRVSDQFFVEYYSHVMHIVSNVVGELDTARHDVVDALMAGFPAGTVSGAPKVRAMQIIDELEPEKRGPYGGCVGYFSADGAMDTCIVLRTALFKDGKMYVQAGAGIVADSDPDYEHNECVIKARALFKAAAEAERFASRVNKGQ